MRVLLASSTPEITKLVVSALERDKHHVLVVETARECWLKLESLAFDLLVVDHRLRDGTSVEVCKGVRAQGARLPIILLTGKRSVARHVQDLNAGADDSLAKPFAAAELQARARALGRRAANRALVRVRDEVILNFRSRLATVRGVEVSLTKMEWSILTTLADAQGRFISGARLMEEVWGEGSAPSSASLEVLLRRVRKKLGAVAVRTLRTKGYALAVL